MADDREFMHGVDLLKVDDQVLTVFSSNNYPPTAPSGNWDHDTFFSWLDPNNPALNVETLYGGVEAQEPASTAINSNGRILVTSEDGSDGINQYAGIWDSELNELIPYPDINIRTGGHSGHVTALGDQFLVAYGEGWVDGGGYNDLGTGADVLARFVSEDGETGDEIMIAQGRHSWPVTASSDNEALVVWQEYEGNSLPSLHSAIITSAGEIEGQTELMPATFDYNYDVQYVDALNQYLVVGSNDTGAYGVLVGTDGGVTATETGIDALSVREAAFAVNGTTAVYPTDPSGLAVLDLADGKIEFRETIAGNVDWSDGGTDGIFLDDSNVLFAGNTPDGLQLMLADVFSVEGSTPESPSEPVDPAPEQPVDDYCI